MVSVQYKSWAWVVTVLASLSVVSSVHVVVEPEPTTGKLLELSLVYQLRRHTSYGAKLGISFVVAKIFPWDHNIGYVLTRKIPILNSGGLREFEKLKY